MSFAWPWALALLLAVPALTAAYLWQLRRRRRQAVRHSNVALVRAAVPPRHAGGGMRSVALVLASLALMGFAALRPQVQAQVPVASAAVIVAVDVSGLMCATDVEPNRLAAAQDAVRAFVAAQEDNTRIGLVLFSGFAQLAVLPTTDHDAVRKDRHPDDGARHDHRRRHPQVDRRDRRDQPGRPGCAGVGIPARQGAPHLGLALPVVRLRRPLRSSSCSPTAPTTAQASPPRRQPSRPRRAGCASTRSGSGPPTPHGSSLPRAAWGH